MGAKMSKPDDHGPADERAEQTEGLVDQGRRDALMRFAKYTPPAMLAVLISASVSEKAFASTSPV